MTNREPYPHLSDAELDEVIADWTADERPAEPASSPRILRALAAKIARRIRAAHDRAA